MEPVKKESLTLAKALSTKNRLAGRLSQTKKTIETYNSILASRKGKDGQAVDVRGEYARFLMIQEGLVVIKAAIHRANSPIYEEVLRLGEKKALLLMLGDLETKHGTEPGYNGAEYHFEATMHKPEILEMVRRIEADIDKIQDKLDQFNATTRVEIETSILELAR